MGDGLFGHQTLLLPITLQDTHLTFQISVTASTLSCAHAGSSTTEAPGAILTDFHPSKRARRLAHAVNVS
jgi:hypothetical protein